MCLQYINVLYSLFAVAVLYQKRLKKERKARRRLQDQLELEMKRRSQLEEALKNSGAPPDVLRVLNGKNSTDTNKNTTIVIQKNCYNETRDPVCPVR